MLGELYVRGGVFWLVRDRWLLMFHFLFFRAEDGIRDRNVTGVQTCALPISEEGELAKVRATVVSAAALADVALELELGEAILLGKGEDASGGREKPSILADATEAVIGAVYLDGGWSAAADLVLDLLGSRIASAALGPGGQDYKTRLQELAAREHEAMPEYAVVDDGPD